MVFVKSRKHSTTELYSVNNFSSWSGIFIARYFVRSGADVVSVEATKILENHEITNIYRDDRATGKNLFKVLEIQFRGALFFLDYLKKFIIGFFDEKKR